MLCGVAGCALEDVVFPQKMRICFTQAKCEEAAAAIRLALLLFGA
jgi:hypothetical protein